MSYLLKHQNHQLILINSENNEEFKLDLISHAFNYRLNSKLVLEHLIQACGVTRQYKPSIIDATAGFAEDSLLLIAAGCKVTLIERVDLIFALLADAINKLDPRIKQNITLIHDDAKNFLSQLTTDIKPDVIYLDPMFNKNKKSAKPKKKTQILQELAGDDTDSDALFHLAYSKAKSRVVVKRHITMPAINNTKPTYSKTGKTARFDVYIIA